MRIRTFFSSINTIEINNYFLIFYCKQKFLLIYLCMTMTFCGLFIKIALTITCFGVSVFLLYKEDNSACNFYLFYWFITTIHLYQWYFSVHSIYWFFKMNHYVHACIANLSLCYYVWYFNFMSILICKLQEIYTYRSYNFVFHS